MSKQTRYRKAPQAQANTAVVTDETRQHQMLAAIRQFNREHGMPPTLREVGHLLGIDSTGYLTWLRDDLKRRALLTFDARTHRSMRLTPAGHLALRERDSRRVQVEAR